MQCPWGGAWRGGQSPDCVPGAGASLAHMGTGDPGCVGPRAAWGPGLRRDRGCVGTGAVWCWAASGLGTRAAWGPGLHGDQGPGTGAVWGPDHSAGRQPGQSLGVLSHGRQSCFGWLGVQDPIPRPGAAAQRCSRLRLVLSVGSPGSRCLLVRVCGDSSQPGGCPPSGGPHGLSWVHVQGGSRLSAVSSIGTLILPYQPT